MKKKREKSKNKKKRKRRRYKTEKYKPKDIFLRKTCFLFRSLDQFLSKNVTLNSSVDGTLLGVSKKKNPKLFFVSKTSQFCKTS